MIYEYDISHKDMEKFNISDSMYYKLSKYENYETKKITLKDLIINHFIHSFLVIILH